MHELIAYNNNSSEKRMLIDRMRGHRAAETLTRGIGWEEQSDGVFRGCMIGCLFEAYDHAQLENHGIPQALGHLADVIFEGLPQDQWSAWPERFLTAIEPGADLSRVQWRFLHWLLTDEAVNPGINHPIVKEAVAECAGVMSAAAETGVVDGRAAWGAGWSAESAARSAVSAARSAVSAARSTVSAVWGACWSAESTAWSAESASSAALSAKSAARDAALSAKSAARDAALSAESAARSAVSAGSAGSAARDAARSAGWSAESAGWSAESAARSAARSAAHVRMANKLEQLLAAEPAAEVAA